jgi:hypothetical protein
LYTARRGWDGGGDPATVTRLRLLRQASNTRRSSHMADCGGGLRLGWSRRAGKARGKKSADSERLLFKTEGERERWDGPYIATATVYLGPKFDVVDGFSAHNQFGLRAPGARAFFFRGPWVCLVWKHSFCGPWVCLGMEAGSGSGIALRTFRFFFFLLFCLFIIYI